MITYNKNLSYRPEFSAMSYSEMPKSFVGWFSK